MKQIFCLTLRSLSLTHTHSLDVGCVCASSQQMFPHTHLRTTRSIWRRNAEICCSAGWRQPSCNGAVSRDVPGYEPGCAEVISDRWRCAGGRAAVRVPVNGAELWGLWMLLPGSAGLALPTITSARPDGEETLTWTPFVRVQSVCAAHAQSSSRCCWIIHTRACTRTALARGTADSDVTRTL